MALLYTKTRRSPSGAYTTDLVNSAGKDWDSQFWLGKGIFSTGRRPCFENYRGDIYVGGAFSRILVRHKQDRRMLPAGILPMATKLAIANGAGAGGDTGRVLGFVTLLHKIGDTVLAESDWSNVVDVGMSTGQGWVWTNLPTASQVDYRVTHIRGYRSVDGSDYMKAWEAAIGIPSFTENVLTRNLTVPAPPAGRNGVPPRGVRLMVNFAGRMYYASTAEHPYRLWRSAAGFPQYVNVENDFVDTWDRSAITCVAKARNDLLCYVMREAYLARQFGQEELSDLVLLKMDNSVGCINHFGAVEIHNKLWFPSEDGVWLYDGSFKYLMRDLRPYWVADYKANPLAFQTGFGYDDRNEKTYVFATGRDPQQDLGEKTDFTIGSLAYVGTYDSYEPSMGGENPAPEWTLDAYARRNSAALYNKDGDVLIGSCDGIIREHDASNADDDNDALGKALLVRSGHQVYQRPGDDIESGKTLTRFWAYVQAEFNSWTLYLLGGDEDAWNRVRPDNVWGFWKKLFAASLKVYSQTIGTITKNMRALPKTVHVSIPEKVTGRGWVTEIRGHLPLGMKIRGWGGAFQAGPADRPPEVETAFTIALLWRKTGDPDWLELPVSLTAQQRTPNLSVDFKTSYVELFGVTLPIDFTLDFAGAGGLPADVVDQITVAPSKTDTVVFTGLDVAVAAGTVSASAEDAGNVPAEAAVGGNVHVDAWDVELEYRINGGAWTPNPFPGSIAALTTDVVEVRVHTYGSRFPTSIVMLYDSAPLANLDPVAAAGTYLQTAIPAPGGPGAKSGLLVYQDSPFSNILTTQTFEIVWS
jgi:hypothetical protein